MKPGVLICFAAWILWRVAVIPDGGGNIQTIWLPEEAYDTKAQCQTAETVMRAQIQQPGKTAPGLPMRLTCLPDAIQPPREENR